MKKSALILLWFVLFPSAAKAAPPQVRMGEPVLIVEGPAEERRWGRYQFPRLYRGAAGEVIAFVHVEPDMVESYGKPPAAYVSTDEGASWKVDPEAASRPYGFRLANGDYLQSVTTAALEVDEKLLPDPVASQLVYADGYKFYRLADLSEEMRLIFFDRFPMGGTSWQRESTRLTDQGGLRGVVRGRLPRIWWGDMRTAKDGSLVAVVYPSYQQTREKLYCQSACYRSTDNGRHWQLQGRIPYRFDRKADPRGAERGGYFEPALEILADGSLFVALRTTDSLGLGPMYCSRSQDLGHTWTRPRAFTPTGVMPRLLRLGNGTLVMTSGRPGVDLRFSFDGRGRHWTEPRTLVPADPAKPQADSCGYTDLLALDGDNFLLVYSWFKRPGMDGQTHKAILVRRITVTR